MRRLRAIACNIEPLVIHGNANDYQIKGTLGITAQLSDRDVHRPDRLRPRCWLTHPSAEGGAKG